MMKGRFPFAAVLGVLGLAVLSLPSVDTPVWSQTVPPGVVRSESDSPTIGDTLRLSLDAAIRLALEHNEDIGIARADFEKAKGRKKEATSAALPYLGFRAGYTRNILRPVIFFNDPSSNEVVQIEIGEENDWAMNLHLTQVLYAFGRVGGAIAAADYYLRSNEANLEATTKDVRLQTETAYLDALLAVEVRDIAVQSLESARRQFEETRNKLRQNVASRFDSIRVEVEVKNREPAVLIAENQIRLARLNLKRIMGVDRDTPVELTDSLVFEPEEYSLQEAIEEAYKMRSDVQALRLRVAMTEKIYQVMKRSNYPYLSLDGDYTIQGQSSDKLFPDSGRFAKSLGIGISLSFPLFDGLQNRGRVAQARADVSAVQYGLQKLENVVALGITEIYDQLEAEKKNLQSQQATVGMAEEAYRLAMVRFTNGLSTPLELEDSDLALRSARLNYKTAVYRYTVAKKRFEYAMGH